MKFWNQYPLLRVLFPIILGVLIAYYSPGFNFLLIIPLSIFITFLLWIIFRNWLTGYKLRFLGSVLVTILFLFLGFFLTRSQQENSNKLHYSNFENITHFLVRINAPFSSTQKTNRTIGEVMGVNIESDSLMHISIGKLLLYFQKEDTLLLKYGDELIVNAKNLSPIKNMGNPHEFDYKAYLARHQVYDQMYLKETDWLSTGFNSSNIVMRWSYDARNSLISILNSYSFSKQNFAVASAILVGYDEYLDENLRQLYAGSGAMHILCVSGLHVGIIFLILNTLLKPLERKRSSKYAKVVLIVLMIWFYALITGMSPSVFRAATMFSFISFGQLINRKTSVYNSLTASAIVLILADPLVIFHIGFQLSYSAILGILLIQPLISSWLTINNVVGKYFWELLAVSIAAQIGTFPISIYYFHQFPNYFFLTNLFVIPLSFVVLITGFVTLLIDLLGLSGFLVFSWIKDVLDILLSILNSGVGWINQIPYSISHNLYFSAYDVGLIYLFVGLLLAAVLNKIKKLLTFSLAVFILLMGFNGINRLLLFSNNTETLTIYNIPNNALLELNKGKRSVLLIDSVTLANDKFSRYISENLLQRRVKEEEIIILDSILKSPSVTRVGQWKFLIQDDRSDLPDENVSVDFLWVRSDPKKKPFLILEKVKPKTVVFDGTNSYWNAKYWEKECDLLNISFHNLKEKGAFIIKTP